MKEIILGTHGKVLKERKLIEDNIESLKKKIDSIIAKENKKVDNQEVKEKTRNFLKADYINKEILFDIINRIEIDENKKVYIFLNFEQSSIYDSEGDNDVTIP